MSELLNKCVTFSDLTQYGIIGQITNSTLSFSNPQFLRTDNLNISFSQFSLNISGSIKIECKQDASVISNGPLKMILGGNTSLYHPLTTNSIIYDIYKEKIDNTVTHQITDYMYYSSKTGNDFENLTYPFSIAIDNANKTNDNDETIHGIKISINHNEFANICFHINDEYDAMYANDFLEFSFNIKVY